MVSWRVGDEAGTRAGLEEKGLPDSGWGLLQMQGRTPSRDTLPQTLPRHPSLGTHCEPSSVYLRAHLVPGPESRLPGPALQTQDDARLPSQRHPAQGHPLTPQASPLLQLAQKLAVPSS